MADISGFGTRVKIVASNSFPLGFSSTEFSDDADPIDMASIKIADSAMSLGGTLLTWATAVPIPIVITAYANSDFDKNLSFLLNENRVAKGKRSARDSITMVVSYPNGDSTTLVKGIITDGPPSVSIASAGKLKTNAYSFTFQDVVKVLND